MGNVSFTCIFISLKKKCCRISTQRLAGIILLLNHLQLLYKNELCSSGMMVVFNTFICLLSGFFSKTPDPQPMFRIIMMLIIQAFLQQETS